MTPRKDLHNPLFSSLCETRLVAIDLARARERTVLVSEPIGLSFRVDLQPITSLASRASYLSRTCRVGRTSPFFGTDELKCRAIRPSEAPKIAEIAEVRRGKSTRLCASTVPLTIVPARENGVLNLELQIRTAATAQENKNAIIRSTPGAPSSSTSSR